MLPKCQDNTKASLLQTTVQHINQFATEGLRTLAVAVKTLTLEDYQEFDESLTEAKKSKSPKDRKVKISALYEKMEDNLELVGAIGIEDKLQEGVKDTLVALGKAGIKVWILTGDKKETAIEISKSC